MEELLQKYRTVWDAWSSDRQAEMLADAIEEAASHLASLQAGLAEYRQKYYPEIAALETDIKATATGPIEAHGVKVAYRRGYTRTSWDNKALTGYAAAHPEILPFRSESEVAPVLGVR